MIIHGPKSPPPKLAYDSSDLRPSEFRIVIDASEFQRLREAREALKASGRRPCLSPDTYPISA